MTANQRIKKEICLIAVVKFTTFDNSDGRYDQEMEWLRLWNSTNNVDDAIDGLYDELLDSAYGTDLTDDFRNSGVETTLTCPYSRHYGHYEVESVAAKLSDGVWVGWNFYYGGGKHGQPSGVEWLADAYYVDVTETEKLVAVREFKKREPL